MHITPLSAYLGKKRGSASRLRDPILAPCCQWHSASRPLGANSNSLLSRRAPFTRTEVVCRPEPAHRQPPESLNTTPVWLTRPLSQPPCPIPKGEKYVFLIQLWVSMKINTGLKHAVSGDQEIRLSNQSLATDWETRHLYTRSTKACTRILSCEGPLLLSGLYRKSGRQKNNPVCKNDQCYAHWNKNSLHQQ